jgi:DNA-damage-inducible protein D
MNKELIIQMQSQFDELAKPHPDEPSVEFWFARDLQEPLGYARWENFLTVIQRAVESCKTTGYEPEHHFRGVTKMVPLGSGAERPIEDFMLTRYACYLIAQNGDPRKEPIAFAQSYFAVQTRKQELIEERMKLIGRMEARENCAPPKERFLTTFLNAAWMMRALAASDRKAMPHFLVATLHRQ